MKNESEIRVRCVQAATLYNKEIQTDAYITVFLDLTVRWLPEKRFQELLFFVHTLSHEENKKSIALMGELHKLIEGLSNFQQVRLIDGLLKEAIGNL